MVPEKVNGKTQAWPAAGPLEVTQLVLAAVVVLVVVVVVVDVDTVVVVVVGPAVVVVVVVVVVVAELEAEGQELGQNPYLVLLLAKLPPASTSVAHQAELLSTVAHWVYTIPLYLKGNTQALPVSGPEEVVQEGTLIVSWEHPEVVAREQSPHWPVMTVPSVPVWVAHQDTGESA